MNTIDGGSPRVSVRLGADAPVFVFAAESLEVPAHLSQRCELLLDLREQADDPDSDLSLPLTPADLKAWVECALMCGENTDTDDETEDVGEDEHKLAKALKVRCIAHSCLSR